MATVLRWTAWAGSVVPRGRRRDALAQLPAIGAGGLLHPGGGRSRAQSLTAVCHRCSPARASHCGAGAARRPRPRAGRSSICTASPTTARAPPASSGVFSRADSASSPTTAARMATRTARVHVWVLREARPSPRDRYAPPGPVVLFGTSLGAAVALQEAADDPRVSTRGCRGDVLGSAHRRDRARAAILHAGPIDRAFEMAEAEAHFRVDDVQPQSPRRAESPSRALIHGADGCRYAACPLPARPRGVARATELILVPGAHHNGSLNGAQIWTRIEPGLRR